MFYCHDLFPFLLSKCNYFETKFCACNIYVKFVLSFTVLQENFGAGDSGNQGALYMFKSWLMFLIHEEKSPSPTLHLLEGKIFQEKQKQQGGIWQGLSGAIIYLLFM